MPVGRRPERNPHRTGFAWTLSTVAAILANPRYTGRQVWNRQRTDSDLVDPANTGLGHSAFAAVAKAAPKPSGSVANTCPP
jgi:site-specific DNA recombinase